MMEQPVAWERVAREVVFEGRVVTVVRDRVRLRRDGEIRETEYDLVHHPGAVAMVALFDDGSIALMRQFRYSVGGAIWEIPAGTLEPGESFEACARRELAEEVGRRAARWTRLSTFYTTPGFCDEVMQVFLAEALDEVEGAADDDELFEVVRIPITEALAWAEDGTIADAKTLVGLHAARARLVMEERWPPAR